MTNIKNIGKELLGRSLNNFHKKTGLTQLEKNNEMQDGILDGILSQVNDAYIEKTEQSNVIHLDGSGDGVVVVDNIEGNTLVNCVKNYDENNFSLRNAVKQEDNYFKIQYGANVNSSQVAPRYGNHIYKPDTKYTVIVNIKENTCGKKLGLSAINSPLMAIYPNRDFQNLLGISSLLITTKNDITITDKGTTPTMDLYFGMWEEDGGDLSNHITFKYWILEGDWTNKELPPFFEGLQSSFEEKVNDVGKYEIEILMNNKNLFDTSELYESGYSVGIPTTSFKRVTLPYTTNLETKGVCMVTNKLKKGVTYTFNVNNPNANCSVGMSEYLNKNDCNNKDNAVNYINHSNNRIKISFTPKYDNSYILINIAGNWKDGSTLLHSCTESENYQLEKGSTNTNFISRKQNKIKVSINEPLRAIDNIKDRLCIKDGKLTIERRIKNKILRGIENWVILDSNTNTIGFAIRKDKEFNLDRYGEKYKKVLNNKFPTYTHNLWNDDKQGFVAENDINGNIDDYQIQFRINKNSLNSVNVIGLKEYLSLNNINILFATEPYYEEVLNEYGEPILLEGYENGTIYVDSVIVPTTTVRYTPKMESLKTLKEVNDNNIMLTNDVSDNIIPYMMEVDMMIIEKEMALMSQINKRRIGELDMTSMQKRTFEMLTRLIKGKTLTEQECKDRVVVYLDANKITSEQAEELMILISEVYA